MMRQLLGSPGRLAGKCAYLQLDDRRNVVRGHRSDEERIHWYSRRVHGGTLQSARKLRESVYRFTQSRSVTFCSIFEYLVCLAWNVRGGRGESSLRAAHLAPPADLYPI